MNKKEFILKNKYFAVRHGESMGNAREVIVSGMFSGCDHFYGLTKRGVDQVIANSILFMKNTHQIRNRIVVISSPFSRAMETASILRGMLSADIIFTDMRLRERGFGEFELKSPSQRLYKMVWAQDKKNPNHRKWGVQSASDVAKECLSFLYDCEKNFSGDMIFLVSHGDRLQIMQTVFEGVSPSLHRSLPHLETAEIRELKLSR